MRRRRANAHNKLWWMKNTVPIHRPFLNELITASKRRNSNYGFTYASFLHETVMFFSKFQTYLFFCAKVVIKTLSNDWVFSSCSNKKVDSLAGTINASGFERDNSDEHAVLIFYRDGGARERNEPMRSAGDEPRVARLRLLRR